MCCLVRVSRPKNSISRLLSEIETYGDGRSRIGRLFPLIVKEQSAEELPTEENSLTKKTPKRSLNHCFGTNFHHLPSIEKDTSRRCSNIPVGNENLNTLSSDAIEENGLRYLDRTGNDSLKKRLEDLKLFVEEVRGNMEQTRPRNHRTLEFEYRRLRRQLHQKADDSVYRRFTEQEEEVAQKKEQWVDFRSGSQLLIRNNSQREDAADVKSRSRLDVKGRDLCWSVEDIVRKEKIRFSNNDFVPVRKSSSPEQNTHMKKFVKMDDVPLKTKTKATIVNNNNENDTCGHSTNVEAGRRHSADDIRPKSNSKGHRVRFAPDVKFSSASDIVVPRLTRNKKQKISINITSVSGSFYFKQEPRLQYTTRVMSLIPVGYIR